MSRPESTFTLRAARERYAGLSREAVAARVSISSKTLERYEKANEAPRHVVVELAEVYGLPVWHIDFEPRPARRVAA